MSENISKLDVVRNNYNVTNFDYEVRRLPQESPVEYAMTLRWLDRWVADGAVVADVGVGGGHYALHLAQRGCQIHLVDLAERLLQTARTRLHKAGLQEAILGETITSATNLHALPDTTFDVVLLLGPLYHLCTLAERQQAVKEAQRLLKPEGIVFAAGINRLAYLRALWETEPHVVKIREAFHREYLKGGVVDPEHAPPLGYAHLTNVAEFRTLFDENFEEEMVAGVESFTGHAQKQLHQLQEADREAWLDLIETTAIMTEGYGPAEHILYVGRKR